MNIFPISAVLMLLCAEAACGFSFRTDCPQGYYKGIDAEGHVLVAEKLGEIQMRKLESITVWAEFNSAETRVSPYLGKGWTLGLVESHLEKIDDNNIRAVMPDGWSDFFVRPENSQNFVATGWFGRLNPQSDTFTAWGSSAWRVIFIHGKVVKIASIISSSEDLTFKYPGDLVTEIDRGSSALVSITMAPSGGAQTIQIGVDKVDVKMVCAPRIEVAEGQVKQTGDDPALGQLTFSKGGSVSFDYGTNSEKKPTLTVTEVSRTPEPIVWNPMTKQIEKDGDWSHQLKPGEGHNEIPVTRVNSKGQTEYHFNDAKNGILTDQTLDGVKTETDFLVLDTEVTDKVQKITKTTDGVTNTVYQETFDEHGKSLSIHTWSPPETPEQTEAILTKAVNDAPNAEAKDNALVFLGFYMAHRQEYEKIRILAKSLPPDKAYPLLLFINDRQPSLTPAEKIKGYQDLEKQYPEHHDELERGIAELQAPK